MTDHRYHPPPDLPLSAYWLCNACGALVFDRETHSLWHNPPHVVRTEDGKP